MRIVSRRNPLRAACERISAPTTSLDGFGAVLPCQNRPLLLRSTGVSAASVADGRPYRSRRSGDGPGSGALGGSGSGGAGLIVVRSGGASGAWRGPASLATTR